MRVLRVLLFVVLILTLTATPAAAADIRQGNEVTIGTTETVEDDLYAFGQTIAINGTVRGDVVAVGNNVSVDGSVTGDLIAAANFITIRGQVGGSVRAAGATVFVDGKVGGDIFGAGNEITVSANGQVGRDAIVAGNTVTLGGQIGRHVQAGSRAVTVDGRVGGNVTAQVESLRLTQRAAIDGAVNYTSPTEASIEKGAVVKGTTTRTAPPPSPGQPVQGPASIAIDWLRGLVGLLVLGLFIVFFFPAFARRSGEALVRSPLLTLAIGALVLIGLPILAVVIFILGAIVGGWWLGLVALAFYFAAIAVSVPVAALGFGASIMRITGRPAHVVLALLVGLIVLLLIGLVPILGGLVIFLAVLFGLGATTMAVAGGRQAEPAAA
jgi:cytoskeletal protein CcmA (bactofilin family)